MFFLARTAARITSAVLQTAHPIEKVIATAKLVERIGSVRQNSVRFVVIKTEDLPRTKADCEYGPPDNRRHDALEAAAVDRKFRFKDRMFVIQHGSPPRRDGSKRARRLSRRHLSNPRETMSHPLHP